MESIVSRQCWKTLEPVHAQVYFAQEAQQEYAALGFDIKANPAAGYFPARAAAMGAVTAGVVQATFFNFSPIAVIFGMDRAWEITTPDELVQARFRGADRALRRLCGDLLDSVGVVEAVELAMAAVSGCSPEGRPLYAANAALDCPQIPHLQLFHAITLLREFRGDGHIAALVVEGITGLQAAVMHVAQGDAWTREPLRKTRGYTTEEWDASVATLCARGWLDEQGAFTTEGAAVRQRIEDRTDELALCGWATLGDDGASRLRKLVRPLSEAVLAGGGLKIR